MTSAARAGLTTTKIFRGDYAAVIILVHEEKDGEQKRFCEDFKTSSTVVMCTKNSKTRPEICVCKSGSGQPCNIQTKANIDHIVCNKENDPGTGRSLRHIKKQNDLQLLSSEQS